MEVERDRDFNASALLQTLNETFPDKGMINEGRTFDFNKWKVDELKTFLKVSKYFKGLSKANKGILVVKVQEIWKRISAEAMFTKNDISDELLMNLPSTSSAVQKPPHPETQAGMTKEDFAKWTVADLSQYLADRCINRSGNKEKLVDNVYGAYVQKLPVTYTDPQQEQEQILRKILRTSLFLRMG